LHSRRETVPKSAGAVFGASLQAVAKYVDHL